jgi:hypothetical protein
MEKGIVINLSGAHVGETAKVLTVRLIEMGRNVEHLDAEGAAHFGTVKAAAYASQLLARNGVVVIVTHPKLKPRAECVNIDVDANDTPDFAAEKILDELAAAKVITLDTSEYSPEEEEQIRKRLADLGYIE